MAMPIWIEVFETPIRDNPTAQVAISAREKHGRVRLHAWQHCNSPHGTEKGHAGSQEQDTGGLGATIVDHDS